MSAATTDAARNPLVDSMRQIVAHRKAQRIRRAGHLYHPLAPRHGHRSIYNAWGCRCIDCRHANATYQRTLKQRRDTELVAA